MYILNSSICKSKYTCIGVNVKERIYRDVCVIIKAGICYQAAAICWRKEEKGELQKPGKQVDFSQDPKGTQPPTLLLSISCLPPGSQ